MYRSENLNTIYLIYRVLRGNTGVNYTYKERFCDSRSNDVNNWIMKKTNGKGADVFFECVGKNDTLSIAVDVAAPSGKIVFVGNPYSDSKRQTTRLC